MPERIHQQRLRGWRMPANTRSVARPSKWGNPWRAEVVPGLGWACVDTRNDLTIQARDQADAHDLAVAHYRQWVQPHADTIRRDLAGMNLVCWCRPGLPCHADVLLELANAEPNDD